jgi:pimeloyl-ACP methyl ester carboxylesterase
MSQPRIGRRVFLRGLAAASAATLLPGCGDLIEDVAQTCPTDPAAQGVTWVPDVGHPVFAGVRDLGPADGAPRIMQIYYPSVARLRPGPIIQQCLTRWPVVLFLHGQPPSGISNVDYHRRWRRIAAVLARCGYVVVVPSYRAVPPTDNPAPVEAALRDIDWVRTQWSEAEWVHKGAMFTAIVGHSYGALLGARVAAARPDFGAFVSLGGTYPSESVPWPPPVAPSLFMWANGPGTEAEQLDQEGSRYTWASLASPRYAAVYQGQHFDYLDATDTGAAPRGPCQLVGPVAADLMALFIARFVPIPLSRTEVPVDLSPPQVQLTPEQEPFGAAHLEGQRLFDGSRECRLDLRWDVEGTTGSRHLGR